ncbi:MAG: hypothetical protein KF915_18715 [Polyangiaceae bacterium]|nr:hypothetical protein [Polyangiaceae bacterium]
MTGLTSTKRFELHRQLRNKIEAAYQPSDGAFEQAQVRQDRYATLVIQRERVAEALACANEPALCCPVPPAPVTSGTKVQIISKAKGWIYSNPDPTRALLAENRIRYFDYSNEFNMLEQIAVQQQLRVVGGVRTAWMASCPLGARCAAAPSPRRPHRTPARSARGTQAPSKWPG